MDSATIRFLYSLQNAIASLHRLRPLGQQVAMIGGVDIAYRGPRAVSVAVMAKIGAREANAISEVEGRVAFPYLPGLLFMREAPLMLEAVRALAPPPDLLLVDGHGLAHPRGAGLGVLVGLTSNLPTLGVAKSLLVGAVGRPRGPFAPLRLDAALVGYAVHSAIGPPYYVSPGHHVVAAEIPRVMRLIGTEYPWVLREADRRARVRMKVHGDR